MWACIISRSLGFGNFVTGKGGFSLNRGGLNGWCRWRFRGAGERPRPFQRADFAANYDRFGCDGHSGSGASACDCSSHAGAFRSSLDSNFGTERGMDQHRRHLPDILGIALLFWGATDRLHAVLASFPGKVAFPHGAGKGQGVLNR